MLGGHLHRLGADGGRVHDAGALASAVSRVHKVVLQLLTAHIHSHLFESENVTDHIVNISGS